MNMIVLKKRFREERKFISPYFLNFKEYNFVVFILLHLVNSFIVYFTKPSWLYHKFSCVYALLNWSRSNENCEDFTAVSSAEIFIPMLHLNCDRYWTPVEPFLRALTQKHSINEAIHLCMVLDMYKNISDR